MSKSAVSRMSPCCWRSLSADFHLQKQIRRSIVTLQRAPAEKLAIPSNLPSQYWSQLPDRFRPDKAKREIVIHESPRSEAETCKDPVSVVDKSQLAVLDPTGARAKLFDKTNKDRARVGDVLLATFTSGEPVSGVILSIKGASGPHASVLLRNNLTGVGMEMQVKVHSPLVQSMEIAQRGVRRKRRARIYYLRKPEHDVGSVQKVVDQYVRQRALLVGGKTTSRFARSKPKKGKR